MAATVRWHSSCEGSVEIQHLCQRFEAAKLGLEFKLSPIQCASVSFILPRLSHLANGCGAKWQEQVSRATAGSLTFDRESCRSVDQLSSRTRHQG